MSLRADLAQLRAGWRWGSRPPVPRSVEEHAVERHAFPTEWARGSVGRAARAAVLAGGFAPLLRLELDAHVYGLEMLERVDPPVLFVANHSSHLDAPLLLTSLPRPWRARTAVAAASDYFFDVWWRAVGTALAFNTFPVERAGARRSAGPAQDLLDEGWSIVVFPEGTRTHDGWIGEFRAGAARLAVSAGVPVVPVGVHGTYQAMPRGRGWPVRGRPTVSVRFGAPLRPASDESTRSFAALLRRAVTSLLHEDSTSWWEARRADAAGRVPDGRGPDAARWRRVWEASRPADPPAQKSAWPR